jgi:hypothetical protein
VGLPAAPAAVQPVPGSSRGSLYAKLPNVAGGHSFAANALRSITLNAAQVGKLCIDTLQLCMTLTAASPLPSL